MQIMLRAESTQDAHNRHSAKERLKTNFRRQTEFVDLAETVGDFVRMHRNSQSRSRE